MPGPACACPVLARHRRRHPDHHRAAATSGRLCAAVRVRAGAAVRDLRGRRASLAGPGKTMADPLARLAAGQRWTISPARRPGHDPAGCLHRRRDHLAAAGHGQRAGPGPYPGRRRDDHLAGCRYRALARAHQCITWTGATAPPGTCRHGCRGHVDDLDTRLPDRHVRRVLVRRLSPRRTSRRPERRRGPADRGAILWAVPALCFLPVLYVTVIAWLGGGPAGNERPAASASAPADWPRPPRGWRSPHTR